MIKRNKSEAPMCELCLDIVDINRQSFMEVDFYERGKFYKKKFFHTRCWNNKINEKAKMMNLVGNLAQRTNNMLADVGY